ncbi:MAG: sulfotransferase [Geminicoccaceae bacterium]|nr:sulfotransferase [Geminicoccaceae bacterium]MCB9945535.1 sulfotransferase [Geminicoccaceae bacterium]
MLASDAFLDFIYVGTPRAGSTWLRTVLNEHPEIRLRDQRTLPPSLDCDPYISALDSPSGLDRYRRLFEGAMPYTVIGDVIPGCITDPFAAGRLARHFPKSKVLVFIRDPIDLIHSLHRHEVQRTGRNIAFAEHLAERPDWLQFGLYHRQLLPYFDSFDADQICVVVYERFFEDEAAHLPQLLRFLDVDERFRPSVMGCHVSERRKGSVSLKRRLSDLIAPQAGGSMGHLEISYKPWPLPPKEPVDAGIRTRLAAALDADIARLERDLGLDLSSWRAGPQPREEVASNVIHLPEARAALQRMRMRASADG